MATIKKALSAKQINGYSQILIRISVSHTQSYRLKSGINVPIKYWNEKTQTIKIPEVASINLRNDLRNLKMKVDNFDEKLLDLVLLFPDMISKDWLEFVLPIVEEVDVESMTKENILLAIDKHNNPEKYKKEEEMNTIDMFRIGETFLAKKNYVRATNNHFRVLFRCASRYEIYRTKVMKKPFKWNINLVSKADIEDFFEYIENEHLYRTLHADLFEEMLEKYPFENTPKHKNATFGEKGGNYLYDMHKRMRTFWNWMREQRYTNNNPMEGVKIGSEHYGTPFYLTIDERNKIANTDLSGNPQLEIQRDIFVFQCFVGCRYGDLSSLTLDNVVEGFLVYVPHKTKDERSSRTISVPLTEKAKELIAKYKGQRKGNKLFPFISQQKYNDAIKDVLTTCKVTRNVCVRNPKSGENEMKPINEVASSHMARRTFAGNVYKFNKDPNIVGKMTGHVEGSKAFARYRDIDEDMLKDAVKAIQ